LLADDHGAANPAYQRISRKAAGLYHLAAAGGDQLEQLRRVLARAVWKPGLNIKATSQTCAQVL
jgi:hypothetical protein